MAVDTMQSAPPGRGRKRIRIKRALALLPGVALLAAVTMHSSPASAAASSWCSAATYARCTRPGCGSASMRRSKRVVILF